jgi:hypothetical protein
MMANAGQLGQSGRDQQQKMFSGENAMDEKQGQNSQ